jgi:hypothetical protein
MWIYLVTVLVVLAIVGGTLGGGVYTIVLIPLAAIVLIGTVVYGMLTRVAEAGGGGDGDAGQQPRRPLPRHQGSGGRVPTSPDRLVDARREQQ